MTRKRKSEATRLDEVDRTLYSTFRGAANSLSQLYTQSMAQQKLSFHTGERHALEKLYQWILRHHEGGSRLTATDIMSHIQHEIDCGEDASASPRLQPSHQPTQNTTHLPNSSNPPSGAVIHAAPPGWAQRSGLPDQPKNSVFSNALSSPVRRSLQPYHLEQGGGDFSNGGRNQESNSLSSNDSAMDMHSDSPDHGSY